jgi:hypothetical protein
MEIELGVYVVTGHACAWSLSSSIYKSPAASVADPLLAVYAHPSDPHLFSYIFI